MLLKPSAELLAGAVERGFLKPQAHPHPSSTLRRHKRRQMWNREIGVQRKRQRSYRPPATQPTLLLLSIAFAEPASREQGGAEDRSEQALTPVSEGPQATTPLSTARDAARGAATQRKGGPVRGSRPAKEIAEIAEKRTVHPPVLRVIPTPHDFGEV